MKSLHNNFDPDTLVLQRPKQDVWWLRFIMTLSFIAFFSFILLVTLLASITKESTFATPEKMLETFIEIFSHPIDLALLLLLGFLPLMSVYHYFIIIRGRLWINKKGIGFQSYMPTFLQGWLPLVSPKNWSVAWTDVSTLQLKKHEKLKLTIPHYIALKIHTKSQAFELFPYQWVNAKDKRFNPCKFMLIWKMPSVEKINEEMQRTPVMEYLTIHQIPSKHHIHLFTDMIEIKQTPSKTRIFIVVFVIMLFFLPLLAAYTIHEWHIWETPSATEQASATTQAQYKIPNSLKYIFFGPTNNMSPLAISPDGKMLAAGSKDRTVHLWSLDTGKSLRILQKHTETVQALVFSPDNKWVASGGDDNTIRIWQVATGRIEKTLKYPSLPIGHKGVYGLDISPNGEWLAIGNWDGTIALWYFANAKQAYKVNKEAVGFWGIGKGTGPGHTNSVNSVAFSSDGKLLASGAFDNTAKVWRVGEKGQLSLWHTFHADNWINVVCFSPDNKLLAGGGFDKKVRVWQLVDGKLLHTFTGHKQGIGGLAFHPSGRMLASSSDDQTIKLWALTEGQLLTTLEGHNDYVNSIAFSPNGQFLASASGDDTVRVWWHEEINEPTTD